MNELFPELMNDVMIECRDHFAINAVYTFKDTNTDYSIKVVFSRENDLYDDTGTPIPGEIIFIYIHANDLPDPPKSGDKIQIKNKTYEVIDPRNDDNFQIQMRLVLAE